MKYYPNWPEVIFFFVLKLKPMVFNSPTEQKCKAGLICFYLIHMAWNLNATLHQIKWSHALIKMSLVLWMGSLVIIYYITFSRDKLCHGTDAERRWTCFYVSASPPRNKPWRTSHKNSSELMCYMRRIKQENEAPHSKMLVYKQGQSKLFSRRRSFAFVNFQHGKKHKRGSPSRATTQYFLRGHK
jgi:hypothetical protein